MEERLSRAEILERLHTEYSRLMNTTAALTPEQQLEPGVVGTWSVKDVLAHLIFWTQLPVDEIEYAGRGEKYEFDHNDDINTRTVAAYQDVPLETVMNQLNDAFERVVRLVENLPDTAFEPDNALECLLEETIAGTLNNNTYDHYALHEAQIRAWVENRKDQ
jgi:hypothetical protein